MAVRTHTNPRSLDLQPELKDILRRNGMQATIVATDTGFQLVVQGHDSPTLAYPITEQQLGYLTDWGTNSANRKAYNTFASLVKDNFMLPRDFVHARNANGRVAMGLHGYRIGAGEYGREGWEWQHGMGWRAHAPGGYGHPFLGWSPRQQEGWHLRRVVGELYYPGAPMVADRPDGRMKPGELQSGGYGFYYKGPSAQQQQDGDDVLAQLQTVLPPVSYTNRPTEPAKPYSEVITSDVYFSIEKWQEVLASHGIVVDANQKTLILQSRDVPVDLAYDLTDEEVAKILNPDLKDVSVPERLDVINRVISVDFADGVTSDMLESRLLVDVKLKPEVETELNQQLAVQQDPEAAVQQDVLLMPQQERLHLPEDNREGVVTMDGHLIDIIDPNQGWYREGRHGREVTVDDIRVEPIPEVEGKFRMTAIIDGKVVSHEISQKDYDKFLALDDLHRFKLFSKIFKEVDLKQRSKDERVEYVQQRGDGVPTGVKVTAGIMAGLTVAGEVIGLVRGPHPGRPMPEVYGGGSVYHKPGVDTPQDIAARAFEAGYNTAGMDHELGRGR